MVFFWRLTLVLVLGFALASTAFSTAAKPAVAAVADQFAIGVGRQGRNSVTQLLRDPPPRRVADDA